ncbi:hypothetical protein GF327_00235 [Candidatus Woesearchaeota archaeon]|nr:hypothetical protein [Candidatus Woesearchaeota archaeon]
MKAVSASGCKRGEVRCGPETPTPEESDFSAVNQLMDKYNHLGEAERLDQFEGTTHRFDAVFKPNIRYTNSCNHADLNTYLIGDGNRFLDVPVILTNACETVVEENKIYDTHGTFKRYGDIYDCNAENTNMGEKLEQDTLVYVVNVCREIQQ